MNSLGVKDVQGNVLSEFWKWILKVMVKWTNVDKKNIVIEGR